MILNWVCVWDKIIMYISEEGRFVCCNNYNDKIVNWKFDCGDCLFFGFY